MPVARKIIRLTLISLGCLFGVVGLFAQKYTPIAGQSLSSLQRIEVLPLDPPGLRFWPRLTTPPAVTPLLLQEGQSPAYQRCQDLALFCRLEVRMEKASRLPVKFRLGEVQQTEKLEGKLKNSEHRRN